LSTARPGGSALAAAWPPFQDISGNDTKSCGMYSVWATDSNGNYISNLVQPESGSSASFEAIETSFHQDLNGDGVIGVPAATGAAATGPAATGRVPQVAPVTIANNDTFIFRSSGNAGAGAGVVIPHHDAFPLDVASQFAAFFHDAQAEFRRANDILPDAGNEGSYRRAACRLSSSLEQGGFGSNRLARLWGGACANLKYIPALYGEKASRVRFCETI
jgi:hypothetical protein